MDKALKLVEKYLLYTIVFLLPLGFANISPNPFVVPKLIILVGGLGLVLIVWCIRVLATGKLEYYKTKFDLPVLLIMAAYLVSALMQTPNKMEAYLLPGTATMMVGGGLLYFLINQQEDKRGLTKILLIGAGVFAFLTLLSAFGALGAIPQLPAAFRAAGFTPEGGFLPAFLFLTPLLALGIGLTILEKDITRKIIPAAASVVIALGVIACIINIIPGSKFTPHFPGPGTSWSISVDALKDSPLLGVGPGNYLSAFNRFRPLEYNNTDLWAVRFGTASNFYLTVLTEAGLLGIAGFILLGFLIYRQIRKAAERKEEIDTTAIVYSTSLGILLVLLIIFPASLLIVTLLFILLALSVRSHHTALHLTAEASGDSPVGSKLPALLVTLPIFVLVAYLFYKGTTIVSAEYKFQKALTALSANDAQKTLDYMNQAITGNPTVDRYHMTAAQVAILIANAIAQKQDISDDDRQTIAALVQTAIEQGKAGVALNPLRAANWDVLAQIYRAIMPLAKDADQFALQTASQAVALDPFNPGLRINLGGIYYAQGDYDNAIKIFETAVAAKNDQPNAYYNLAFAYAQKGDLGKAEQAMSQVLANIKDKSSKDYEVAKKALEDIQAKKKEAATNKGDQLNPPQGQGKELDPKLDLPEGSEPPATPSPKPEAKETEEPKVSVTPELSPTVTPLP